MNAYQRANKRKGSSARKLLECYEELMPPGITDYEWLHKDWTRVKYRERVKQPCQYCEKDGKQVYTGQCIFVYKKRPVCTECRELFFPSLTGIRKRAEPSLILPEDLEAQ
jgi:hypothetical protein